MERAIVFDVGGTYLRSGVLFADGKLGRVERQRLESHVDGYEAAAIWNEIVEAIVDFVEELAPCASPSAPLVVAFPGPVAAGGRVLSAPSLIGSRGCPYDFGRELGHRTGRPVHLLNDLSAAAWYVGTQTDANRFMVVTVSSGIGSKIYDRSQSPAVLDQIPYAGEIGHLVVNDAADAPVCDCGGRGHLGAIASGRGIERAACRTALRDPEEFGRSLCAREFGAQAGRLTNEDHLVPAAVQGDEWALGIIRSCTVPLARALCTVLLGAGLDEVAVIGGFAQRLGQPYLRILGEEFARIATYEPLGEDPAKRIWLAKAGEETCLLGAAEYAALLLGTRE